MGNVFIKIGGGTRDVVLLPGADKAVVVGGQTVIKEMPGTTVEFIDGVFVAPTEAIAATLREHEFNGTVYREYGSVEEARASLPSSTFKTIEQERDALRQRLAELDKVDAAANARLAAQMSGQNSAPQVPDDQVPVATAPGAVTAPLVELDASRTRESIESSEPTGHSGPTGVFVTPLDAHAGEMIGGVSPDLQPIPDLPVMPTPPAEDPGAAMAALDAARQAQGGTDAKVHAGITRAGEAADILAKNYGVDIEDLKGGNGHVSKAKIAEVAAAKGVSFPDL